MKLQKLASELAVVTKEKEGLVKMYEKMMKEKEEGYEGDRQKLIKYIDQLKKNNAILNKKI